MARPAEAVLAGRRWQPLRRCAAKGAARRRRPGGRRGGWCCQARAGNPHHSCCELAGRGEHEFGDSRPVIALDGLHVLAETVGVHGDFRMHVTSQQGRSFGADGAIAEGGAFGGAGDDSDVQGLGHGVISRPWIQSVTANSTARVCAPREAMRRGKNWRQAGATLRW